jgi:hypothetical protein
MWPRPALVHLVAELSGVRIHGTYSSPLIIVLSGMLARQGHPSSAQYNLHSLITKDEVGY